MTFSTQETSRQDSAPVSLLLIRYGVEEGAYYAYNDSEVPVTFGGVLYNPIAIKRARINSSGNLDKKTLEIEITPKAEIVQLFQTGPTSQPVRLTIYQGHADDTDVDFKVVWTGRIVSVTREERTAKLKAQPVSTDLRRPGLRRYYQLGCPYVLYSSQCGADKAAATRTVAVVEAGANFIRLANGWAAPTTELDKFKGGILQWIDEDLLVQQTRTILRIEAGDPNDTIVISGRLDGLSAEGSATLSLGCNRQFSDCGSLHANIVNFGGQPWIPKENPVGGKNNYY